LNAEFRFALVHAALTPIGVIGPVRGVFFFDMGGLWFNEQKFRIFEPGSLRLQDAISSYGYGVEFFLFGYPLHFEWVWKTDFKQKQYSGVNFWIGFDF
jgi:outer membrane protein assembly factor BamA